MTEQELLKDARQYLLNTAILLDEGANSALFFGDPHETISARVGKMAASGSKEGLILQHIINDLMMNPNHCQNAAKKEAHNGFDAVIPDAIPPKGPGD